MNKFKIALKVKELKPEGLKGYLKRHDQEHLPPRQVDLTPPVGLAGLHPAKSEDIWT